MFSNLVLKPTRGRSLLALPFRLSSTSLNQFYIPNKPEEVKFTPKSNKPKGLS